MHVAVSSSAAVPLLPLDTKHVETLKGAYILSLLPQTFFFQKICLLRVTRNHLLSYGVENYPELSYYGGPTQECPYYGAAFWFQEHVKSASAITRHKIVYNLCCKGGKIDLKTYKKPPEPLCTLLCFDGDARSKQFLRQI
jgi:hypothetical protein